MWAVTRKVTPEEWILLKQYGLGDVMNSWVSDPVAGANAVYVTFSKKGLTPYLDKLPNGIRTKLMV